MWTVARSVTRAQSGSRLTLVPGRHLAFWDCSEKNGDVTQQASTVAIGDAGKAGSEAGHHCRDHGRLTTYRAIRRRSTPQSIGTQSDIRTTALTNRSVRRSVLSNSGQGGTTRGELRSCLPGQRLQPNRFASFAMPRRHGRTHSPNLSSRFVPSSPRGLGVQSAFDSGFPSHVVGHLFEDGERWSHSVTASNESSVRDPKRRSSTRRTRRRMHTRSRSPRQSRSGRPSMRRSEGRGRGSRCRSRPDRRNDRTPDRLRA